MTSSEWLRSLMPTPRNEHGHQPCGHGHPTARHFKPGAMCHVVPRYGWDLFKCDLETESKTKSKTPTLHQHIHQLRKSLSSTQIIAKIHEHHSQASGFSRSEVGCELKRRLRDIGSRSWIKPWRRKMTQALSIQVQNCSILQFLPLQSCPKPCKKPATFTLRIPKPGVLSDSKLRKATR